MPFSSVKKLGPVSFPAFTGERLHMRGFRKASGLPADLLRWRATVDAMLDGVDVDPSALIYLMVDQQRVLPGQTHRRSGVHVDGRWCASAQGHRHYMDDEDELDVPRPRAQPRQAETLILASDVLGCVAHVGPYAGVPGNGGSFSHLDLSGLDPVDMAPGWAWTGCAMTMLHESIPVREECLRTVVRLNVKGARV